MGNPHAIFWVDDVNAYDLERFGPLLENHPIFPDRANITLAHIPPAHSENINFFGAIEVDIDGELAQLGPTGYRPLRVLDILF